MPEIYALDLDEELLSHLALPDSLLVIRAEGITGDLIEDDFVRSAFEWQIQHQREHGKPASAAVFADEFDLDLQDPETAIGDLIDRLRERWIRNNGREALEKIGQTYKADPGQVPRMLAEISHEFQEKVARRAELFGTGDYDRAIQRYDKKVLAGPGPSFPFPEMNDHFYGMLGITILLAPPKTMKSWIMVKTLVQNVQEGKHPWLYSLELPAEETDMRIRCMLSDVPFWKYLRNSISKDERRRIKEASESIDSIGAYKIVKPPQGERGIDRMVEVARDAGADVVLFDQLQYIENKRGVALGEKNDTGDYWQVLDKSRNLSDDGPLMFAHQFNRNAMFAEEMPPIEYAKGSSAVEETATLAIGIWGNKDMRRNNVLEIGTLISRNYTFQAWDLGVELNKGCDFQILREAEEDDG